MRYTLLFIIAILLPVFAFLHFTKSDDALSWNLPEWKVPNINTDIAMPDFLGIISNSTRKLLGTVGIGKESAAERVAEINNNSGNNMVISPSATEKAKSAAWLDADTPLNFIAEGENRKYKVPKLDYTEPVKFPFAAMISQPYLENFKTPNFFPIRDWTVAIEDISAVSALAIEPITQKVVYHKNIFDPRPVASLAKLITGLVVIDEMNLNDIARISGAAVSTYGEQGDLVRDERITIENLLYILLITSSNDAALALEEYYNSFRIEGDKTFVAAMNRKAQELGLLDTFFVEPSGLNINNRSTAYDLARLSDHVFQRPILRQIMSTQTIDVHSIDDTITHHLVNSNKLLGVLEGVLAGKTGYTEEAGESIVLFVKKSESIDDYLIYVILGSSDRIKAARQLIDWVKRAYIWE